MKKNTIVIAAMAAVAGWLTPAWGQVSADPSAPWGQPSADRSVTLTECVSAQAPAQTMTLSADRLTQGVLTGSTQDVEDRVNTARIKAPQRALDVKSLYGPTTCFVRFRSNYNVRATDAEILQGTGSTGIIINKFVYADVQIKATVKTADNTVSIPVQVVTELEGGNKVSLCKVDPKNNVYDSKTALTGKIVDGAIIFDDTFGFFVTSGPQTGAYLNVGFMDNAVIGKPNSQMTTQAISFTGNNMTAANRVVTPEVTDTYIYPVGSDRLRVLNTFINSSYRGQLTMTLKPDRTMVADPQKATYINIYGEFCYYKLSEKTAGDGKVTYSASVLSPIPASYSSTDHKMSLSMYGVARPGVALLSEFEGAEITGVPTIAFPAPMAFNLEGDGSVENPYLIKNAYDFLKIGDAVMTNTEFRGAAKTLPGSTSGEKYYPVFAGKHFKLANDIDFSTLDVLYEPIGDKVYQFAGEFDGDGKTISNFTVEDYPYDWLGLFATIAPEGSAKNVTFKNAYLTTLGYSAGVLTANAYGPITNVHVEGATLSAPAGYHVGGIAGYVRGISDCTAKNVKISGLGYFGGIAGHSYGNVTNCHASGTLSMNGNQVFAGGVLGQQSKTSINDPDPVVSDCSFSGSVIGTNNEIGLGGLVGAAGYSSYERCLTAATVNAGNTQAVYMGGLFGSAYQVKVDNCYATGFVRNLNSANAGGLVGHITVSTSDQGEAGKCYFSNSFAAGMLHTKSANDIRGIAGDSNNLTLTNVYYDAQMAAVANDTYGKPTEFLTSGQPIPGFSTDVWDFKAGRYPTFKAYNNANSKVASAAIVLSANENVNDVETDFRYTADPDIKWLAYKDTGLSEVEGYAFAFDKGVGRLNLQQHTDTIFTVCDDASKFCFINIVPVFFDGKGTIDSPWLLKNKDDVASFVNISNAARSTFADKYIALTADVDMEGMTLTPICKDAGSTLKFQGNFDGQGHTLKNFKIKTVGFYGKEDTGKVEGEVNPKSAESYYNGGLFANIGANGVVRNLVIDSSASYELFEYGGAIVGSLEGTVENCYNYADVTTYFGYGGGIAGYVKDGGKVLNCYNAGNVRVNAYGAGGIAGKTLKAEISGCENTGSVKAYSFNTYQKTGSKKSVGGIVGEAGATAAGTVIENVANSGAVSAESEVGGIVGKNVGGNAAGVVRNALNYGIITASKDINTRGAIAGSNNKGTYENCVADNRLQRIGLVAGANPEGTKALPTEQIAGNKELFPAEAWSVADKAYPTVALATTAPQVALNSTAYPVFQGNDFAEAANSAFTLTDGADWTLVNGKAFTISGNKVTAAIADNGAVACDTLVATKGGISRQIPIKNFAFDAFDGDGSQASPFVIATADDFLKLADIVNTTSFGYQGYFFNQTADLDFTGKTFVPVASGSASFNASYTAAGKAFKNVSYDFSSTNDKTKVGGGLFCNVGPNALLSGVVLDETSNIAVYQYAGGIAAYVYGKAENCVNRGNVSTYGSTYAGGIAAKAYAGAAFTGCANEGSVTSKSNYAGGIAGAADEAAAVAFTKCSNSGDVMGSSKNGGIVGSASATLTDCTNSGTVISNSTYAGGIIAEALVPSSLAKCTNSGAVSATQYTAGIVGSVASHTAAAPCTIDECVNQADVENGSKGYSGGIAANTSNYVEFSNCSNTAKVYGSTTTSGGLRLGGIVGSAGKFNNFTECFNTGDIESYSNSGGVIGANSDNSTLTDCYNTGNVTGGQTSNTNIAGICGNGKVTMYRCYNTGDITAAGKSAAGLNGANTGSENPIEECFNSGTITAKSDAGGLLAQARGVFRNCVNFGEVNATTQAAGIISTPYNANAAMYTTRVYDSMNVGKINVSGSKSTSGNIAGKFSGCNFLDVKDSYYDVEINGALPYESESNGNIFIQTTGMSTRELASKQISDRFELAEGMYPMLKAFADNDEYLFHSATAVLAEGDTRDHVTSTFTVGTPAGTTWTCTPELKIEGNKVTIVSKEQGVAAQLTAKGPNGLSKTIDLKLYGNESGVDGMTADSDVVARDYYNLTGVRVATPVSGTVYIVKTTHSDGTVKVAKQAYTK